MCQRVLECHTDAGFRREEDVDGHEEGRATRGTNVFRLGPKVGTTRQCHLLEFQVGTTKQVVRSTLTAEGHAILGAVDTCLGLRVTMDEILHGPVDARRAAQLVESGEGTYQLDCVTDSKNIVAAIEVSRTKVPAEKNFYFHLLWLKDRLMSGALRALVWRDTRDITADGHTKGSIDRSALRKCAAGTFQQTHDEHRLVLATKTGRAAAAAANTPFDEPEEGRH